MIRLVPTNRNAAWTAIVALAWLAVAARASAATYFVRKTGNDANAGTTAATAWQTISKSAATMTAGDTVYVGAGTYSEQVQPVNDGSLASPIRYIADSTGAYTGDVGAVSITSPGNRAMRVDGDNHTQVIGFRLHGSNPCVEFRNCTGGVLLNCEVYGSVQHGIRLDAANVAVTGCVSRNNTNDGVNARGACNVTIVDCSCYSNGGNGFAGQNTTTVVTLDRCKLYSNSLRGANLARGAYTVKNCLVYSNSRDGVRVVTGSPVATLWNCTIAKNGADGISHNAGVATVANCVIANNTDDGFDRNGGTLTHTYNLVYGNTSRNFEGTTAGTGELTSNPLFVNAAVNDFQLGVGSPAINSGTAAAGVVDVDLLNVARPIGAAWDMGCYEAASGGSTPGVRVLEWTEIP